MKKTFSVPAWTGAILVTVGLATMAGWVMRSAALVQVGPDFVSMVFSTALCFTLIGIALLLPAFNMPSAEKKQRTIGWILIAVALAVLAEFSIGFALPLDFPSLHSWIDDGNPVPGRMTPYAAVGFLLAGGILVVMQRVQSKAAGGAIQIATFVLLLIGFIGLATYSLHLHLLYSWVPEKRIAVQSAVCMFMAGVGVWGQWRNADWYRTQRYFRDDEKTGYVAATTLTMIALAAGIVGFAVQQATLGRTLSENLHTQLKNQTSLFHTVVRQSVEDAAYISSRSQIIQLTRQVSKRPADADSAQQLRALVNNAHFPGPGGIAIHDASGREILRLGRFAQQPEIEADLGLPAPVSLLWDGMVLMHSRLPLRDDEGIAGTIIIEQALPLITGQLAESEGFGETGELGICVRQSGRMTCFPQRRNPQVHSIDRLTPNGKLTPMGHATEGGAGSFTGRDYRGHMVLAAYAPLTSSGLGMVIKQDTIELYQPIREQLNWYFPLLLLLVTGGAVLLRSQVKPLVSKLLRSEQAAKARELHIRTVVDNVAEGIITLNENGVVESFNGAASRIFGYSSEEAVGMNIKAMMPPEMRDLHEAGMQRYLREGVPRFVGKGNRELSALHKNGKGFALELAISEIRIDDRRLFIGIVHDITERKRAEHALQESEARSREITETLGEGVFVTDRHGVILFSNPAAQKLLGWKEEELLGQHGHTLLHHSHADGTPYPVEHCAISRVIRSGQGYRAHDETFWRKDGSMVPVSINSTPIIRSGNVVGAVVAFHDIIDRKRSEQELAAESAKNAMLLRTACDGIHVLDLQGNLLQANDAFCRMLGYTPDEMRDMNVTQWDAQWSREELLDKIQQPLGKGSLFETRHRRRDGTVFDVEVHATSVTIDGKQLLYASARDISERKKAAEEVQHLAHFDILTDLPNRALLSDRLQQAIVKARRGRYRMALMFIDLDKFKPVNDTFGHDVGDRLLKDVAKRLCACLRESDTVARVGGDEFVVLLQEIEVDQYAIPVAEKILAALNENFDVAGHNVDISASIGIAVYPDDGNDQEDLMKNADSAMYHAKAGGGNAITLFRQLPQSEILAAESVEPS